MRIIPTWMGEHCLKHSGRGNVEDFLPALEALGHEIEPIVSPYDTCIVVEIVAIDPHPTMARLSVCTLYDGRDTTKVVCGAPNLHKGMRVLWAKIGTCVQGTVLQAKDFGGVSSPGMLCGARELDFFQPDPGLWMFPTATVGQSLTDILQWHNISEIELTPNRGDLLSIRGLTRESAIKGHNISFAPQAFGVQETLFQSFMPWPGTVSWNALRQVWWWEVTGVKDVVPSLNIMARLRQAGLNIHGHIADILNYVMLEFGYPLHVFSGVEPDQNWHFTRAQSKESWTALDGRTYGLEDTMGVLRHHKDVQCVPGVMGSAGFSYHAGDDRAIIEIVDQNFPGAPRLMMSDARTRFDRGVDRSIIPLAISRVHDLLQSCAPKVKWGRKWHYQNEEHGEKPLGTVRLRPSAVQRLTGVHLEREKMQQYLTALGCVPVHKGPETDAKHLDTPLSSEEEDICVSIPPWRQDLGIEEDLVEEVLRCHGFQHITAQAWTVGDTAPERPSLEHTWSSHLLTKNYYEMVHWSFASRAQGQMTGEAFRELSHPLRQDQNILRPRLWPTLLEVLGHHCQRHAQRYPLFERGPVFPAQGPEAVMWSGLVYQDPTGVWRSDPYDVYTAKGHLLSLLSLGGIAVQDLKEKPAQVSWLHPGRSASVWYKEECLGHWGDLHPQVTQGFSHPVGMWEVYEARMPIPQSLAPFVWNSLQPIVKDLGFVLPYHQPVGPLIHALTQEKEGYSVPRIHVFDVFSDENRWGKEKKSVALRLTWYPAQGWTQKDIHAHMDLCIQRAETFHAILRRDEEKDLSTSNT